MVLRGGGSFSVLPGTYTLATLPDPAAATRCFAWVTDRPGGPGMLVSDGTAWMSPGRRVESYSGVTDGSGLYTVTYPAPYVNGTPNVQPACYPPADALTRVRVTAADANGFTVRTEKNATVNVLGIDILSLGTSPMPGIAVRVLVVES